MLTETLSSCCRSPVRIINVASAAHAFGKINFDDLMCEASYDPWKAYGASKLANIMFTYELARRLRPSSSKMTANCLHPGVVRTELGRWVAGT
jgi:NAD(P)-dependent dehydrogenase (short-subunit alcohol dehydrogenase family)